MAIAQFDTFLAVARNGSLSRAASELYLTQPALTNRIRKFEAEVGAPLFTMSPTGAHLTEAGEILLPFITEANEKFEAGLRAVGRHACSGDETVVFRYCDDELGGLFPRLISFINEHDVGLHIDYVRGDTDSNLKAIRDHEADAALLAEPRSERRELDQSLQTDFIFIDPMVLMVWPDHPLVGKTPAVADLAGSTVVVYDHASFRAALQQFETFSTDGGIPITIKKVSHYDEAMMWLKLHRDYMGLFSGSAWEIAQGEGFTLVPLDGVEPLQSCMVTRKDAGPAVRKFVQVARLAYRGYGDLSPVAPAGE